MIQPEMNVTTVGWLHVIIDGKDVTFFRDVPTQIESWSSGDPFGDSTAIIGLPQIKPWERLGEGELDWLHGFADIDILIEEEGGEVTTVWEGMIGEIEEAVDQQAFGLTLSCFGAMHQLDLYVRAPLFLDEPVKAEDLVRLQFSENSRPHIRMAPLEVRDIEGQLDEFKTKRGGSWDRTLTGYLQDLLAEMIHEVDILRQWTLQLERPRKPVLKHKQWPGRQFWTVHLGAPGVTHQLSRDYQQNHNVFYGEGTNQAGTTWTNSRIQEDSQNIKFNPIAYDKKVHRHPDREDENDEFTLDATRIEIHHSHGRGVSLAEGKRSSEQELRRNDDAGWSGTITLQSDPEEDTRYKIKADDNILLKWHRLREPPEGGYFYGYFIGNIDGYTATWRPFDGEVWIDKGDHREHIGTMFHIAGVEMDQEGAATLTVDTKMRDLLTISELKERRREGSVDPAKRLQVNRSSREIEDEKVPWDYEVGSGFIPERSVDSEDPDTIGDPPPSEEPDKYVFINGSADDWRDRWKVVLIRASTKGQIRRTEIRAFWEDGSPAEIKFAAAFFDREMLSDDMPRDPFHEDAWHTATGPDEGKDPLLQQPPDILIGWGRADQGAGFWPGLETDGDPATGVLIDDGTWEYQLDKEDEGNIWLALYAEEDVYFQGRLTHGVMQD